MRLRRSVAGLLIGLAVFLGFESCQPVLRQQHLIFVFVHTVALLAPLSVMFGIGAWRRFGMIVPIVFWCGFYLAGKLVFAGSSALPPAVALQVMIAGTAMLGVLIWLSFRLANDSPDLEDLMQTISPVDSGGSPRILDKNAPEVALYMLQSRRSGRPLGMVIVKPDADSQSTAVKRYLREIERSITKRVSRFRVASLIGSNLRRVDLLIDGMTDGFAVLCPEADRESLDQLAQRIQKTAQAELGLSVACGTASFPGDAFPLDVLARRAEADLYHNTSPAASGSHQRERKNPANIARAQARGTHEKQRSSKH
ncbi:MAG: hypothetical protein ACREVE_04815 [Gammaproteobacteria bacterium]